MKLCRVPGCRRRHHALGYCDRHRQRLRQYGQLERTQAMAYSPAARFWRYVFLEDVLTDGCWPWRGSITAKGYGIMHLTRDGRNTSIRAHRFGYELLVGAIPGGLQLDHLCRNRSCVNPAHLEPVTNAENVRRGWSSRRTSGQGPKALPKPQIGGASFALPR